MSATLESDVAYFTTTVDSDSLDQNQWYFVARLLDHAVIRGGSVVARVNAGRVSSKTVEIVLIQLLLLHAAFLD